MVIAFTGFLALLRDVGLSAATVQRFDVTHEQTSTLFWINVAIGAILAALCAALTWAGLWGATKQPLLSGLLAGAAGLTVRIAVGGRLAPMPYLLVGLGVVLGIYAWIL